MSAAERLTKYLRGCGYLHTSADAMARTVTGWAAVIPLEDLPKVSTAWEESDFPHKDAPRIALAVLLAAGWDARDKAVDSLRAVIAGYEGSIATNAAENADAKKLDQEAEALHDAGRGVTANSIPWADCGEHARGVFRAVARAARDLYGGTSITKGAPNV